MEKAIPYYRVSTARQGDSGLGLEAQRKAVQEYASKLHFELAEEYIEVESGSKNKRPILSQALKQCREKKAILLIAKLDRLGRNVAFIAQLMEADIDFCAVDNPTASRLLLHIMAAFAEHERDQISKRTKDALEAAKRKGRILGKHGRETLSVSNKLKADVFAIKMLPVFEELKKEGHTTIRGLKKELNRQNIKTFFGGNARWHNYTVHALVKRIEKVAVNQLNL